LSLGGSTTLTNVTISDNSATTNGAGFENGGFTTMTNVTFADNVLLRLNGMGGNIFQGYDPTSFVQFKNTLVVYNSSGVSCFIDAGSITSLGHNLSNDNTCNLTATGDMTNTNPLLGPLQNNGGATFTHALLPGSPAINAGDNNGCPSTDQRGVPRPQAGICDIGAYEYVFPFSRYFPIILR
jgi:hypothetical protein